MSTFVKWTVCCFALVTALAGPARADLLVTSFESDQILRFDPTTGGALGVFASGGLGNPIRMTFGPDGNLYVFDDVGSASTSAGVIRFNGTTGAPLGTFVPRGSGGLFFGRGLTFGPDGNLYVYNLASIGLAGSVLRYDGATGASLGTFVPTSSGLAETGNLTFGPDGNLYVGSIETGVLRFDGATGASLGTFIPLGSGGLFSPEDLAFGPDGNLYVLDNVGQDVFRYDGTTGALLGMFFTETFGVTFAFGPDGHLYFLDEQTFSVLRFDATTGALLGTIPLPNGPSGLAFTPVVAIPEPSSLALLGLGCAGLLGVGCWRMWSRRSARPV